MSDKAIAPLIATAFSTVLVVSGSVFSSQDDAGDKVWIRVLQIMVAVIYVVLAFGFIDQWKEYLKNRRTHPTIKIISKQ